MPVDHSAEYVRIPHVEIHMPAGELGVDGPSKHVAAVNAMRVCSSLVSVFSNAYPSHAFRVSVTTAAGRGPPPELPYFLVSQILTCCVKDFDRRWARMSSGPAAATALTAIAMNMP